MKIIIKFFYLIDFVLFYLYDLSVSSLKIAFDVVTYKDWSNPRFIDYRTEAKTDFELTALANLITFSPGSIVSDISEDKKIIQLHVMFSESDDEVTKNIREKLEKRVLRILR